MPRGATQGSIYLKGFWLQYKDVVFCASNNKKYSYIICIVFVAFYFFDDTWVTTKNRDAECE